ncbi:MAG: hypothetical protein ACLRSW_06080 [Christensenellaceae bacterium]
MDNTYSEPAEAGYNLNRDDYKFRDVRLILSDGTVLYDANPDNGGKFSEDMRDVSYSIGDGSAESSLARQYYFRFNVPSEYLNARTSTVDTAQLADGEHTFTVSDGQNSKNFTFYVDNTAPKIGVNSRGTSSSRARSGEPRRATRAWRRSKLTSTARRSRFLRDHLGTWMGTHTHRHGDGRGWERQRFRNVPH